MVWQRLQTVVVLDSLLFFGGHFAPLYFPIEEIIQKLEYKNGFSTKNAIFPLIFTHNRPNGLINTFWLKQDECQNVVSPFSNNFFANTLQAGFCFLHKNSKESDPPLVRFGIWRHLEENMVFWNRIQPDGC